MKIEIYKYLNNWCASLDGPWYDDSNPDAIEKTPEEALDALWNKILALQKELNDFVAEGKPTIKYEN